MDLELWATDSNVSDVAYWEHRFPGKGEELAAITSAFQGWQPDYAPNDAGLEQDVLEATRSMGVSKMRIFPLSQADLAQRVVGRSVRSLFDAVLLEPSGQRRFAEVNDAIGQAFGQLMSNGRGPRVMLRVWLYDLLVKALLCSLTQHADLARIQKVLRRWKQGQYLIGLGTLDGVATALVVVDDP
jgi:hypothetical protein